MTIFFVLCIFSDETKPAESSNIKHVQEKAIQHIPPPFDTGKTRATEETTTKNNSNNHFFVFFNIFIFFLDFFIFMDNGFCGLPAIIHNSNCRSQKYISPIVCLIDFGTKFTPDFHKNEIFQQYELVLHQLYF